MSLMISLFFFNILYILHKGSVLSCHRTDGWCTHSNAHYRVLNCPGGLKVPTCEDSTGAIGQILNINGHCVSTWKNGSPYCPNRKQCSRPKGWCSHKDGLYTVEICNGYILPTCINLNGAKGQRVWTNGRCIDTFPRGPLKCISNVADCVRPNGWCTRSNAHYRVLNCGGKRVPTCTDTAGAIGQVLRINGQCVSTWKNGSPYCPELKQCTRPPGWCSHGGSRYTVVKCNGKVMPTCQDSNGAKGQRIWTNGRCIDTWPRGPLQCIGNSAKVALNNVKIEKELNSIESELKTLENNKNNDNYKIFLYCIMFGLLVLILILINVSFFCYLKNFNKNKPVYKSVKVNESATS